MDKVDIIALIIPFTMFLAWLIFFFILYAIPEKSIIKGFEKWYHEDDNII